MAETVIGTNLVPLTMCSAVVELDQYSPDWQLAEPAGESADEQRAYSTEIHFDAPFANVPMVHVGLVGFDIDNCDTARLHLSAEDITEQGFTLRISTWRDTRVYKVNVSWIALGHQYAG